VLPKKLIQWTVEPSMNALGATPLLPVVETISTESLGLVDISSIVEVLLTTGLLS